MNLNLDYELEQWVMNMQKHTPSAKRMDDIMQEILTVPSEESVEFTLTEQLHWMLRAADLRSLQVAVWIFAILLNLARTVTGISPTIIP